MTEARTRSARVRPGAALGVLALAWVGVYWWWEPRPTPPITFAGTESGFVPPQEFHESRSQEPRDQVEPEAPTLPSPAIEPLPAPRAPLPEPAAPPPAEPTPVKLPPREYTVRRGDTLSGISQRFYSSGRYADLLYRANKSRLKLRSADAITPGDVLVIPVLPEEAGR